MSASRLYGNWAKERSGWFFGLSGAQLGIVALSGLPALIAVGAQRWVLLVLWVPAWAVVVALTAVPLHGRPAFRWLSDVALHAAGGVMGWTEWISRASEGSAEDLRQPDLPGVLAGAMLFAGQPFGPALMRPAIIQDKARRTWAVTARISHDGLSLVEADARNLMGGGLGILNEVLSRGQLIGAVALQVRTVPDDGAERSAWEKAHLRANAHPAALRNAEAVDAAFSHLGVRIEAFCTLVIPEAAARKQADGSGLDARARIAANAMRTVQNALLGPIGCTRVQWLDSEGLAEAVRTGYDPADSRIIAAAWIAGGARQAMAAAGPSRAPRPSARHYTHGSWSSVSCSVLLPDDGAVLGALAPVLTPRTAGERRSLTVFFAPMTAADSSRAVGREQMTAETANEIVRKAGFRQRASRRRDTRRVEEQDSRLAGGRALVRTAQVAAVTVPSEWDVGKYGSDLEIDIRSAGFAPLRLDLAQDAGFVAACIPMGVGLPQRRGRR